MSRLDRITLQLGVAVACVIALCSYAVSILAALASFPLVALGETHRVQEEFDFLTALLHHPIFPDMVDDVVVEFGNALHQPLVDRFLAGELVAAAALRPRGRGSCCSRTTARCRLGR